jgi:hypothetical protein
MMLVQVLAVFAASRPVLIAAAGKLLLDAADQIDHCPYCCFPDWGWLRCCLWIPMVVLQLPYSAGSTAGV